LIAGEEFVKFSKGTKKGKMVRGRGLRRRLGRPKGLRLNGAKIKFGAFLFDAPPMLHSEFLNGVKIGSGQTSKRDIRPLMICALHHEPHPILMTIFLNALWPI
jgi:hypothetical protein